MGIKDEEDTFAINVLFHNTDDIKKYSRQTPSMRKSGILCSVEAQFFVYKMCLLASPRRRSLSQLLGMNACTFFNVFHDPHWLCSLDDYTCITKFLSTTTPLLWKKTCMLS